MSQRRTIQNSLPMLVTTVTRHRTPIFEQPELAHEAIDRIYRIQKLHPFHIFGFVIMPDHVHLLLTVVKPYTISQFMNSYKTGLTFDIGIGPLWQRRYHIRIVRKMYGALQYIHANPVRANLVDTPDSYPWSSASGKYDVSRIPSDFM
jgi:putative transposase